MKIVPAILEKTWPEIENKIRLVEDLVDWVQIDVSDGYFTPSLTWHNYEEFLPEFNVHVEIHLMINEPWLVLEHWFRTPARRFVLQIEAFLNNSEEYDKIISLAKKYNKEIVWGFKIETPWQSHEALVKETGRVLFLSVKPGYQGQEIDWQVLEKVSSLKSVYPNASISVDGGIKLEHISKIKELGVDSAVVGSAIFESADPRQVIAKFLL